MAISKNISIRSSNNCCRLRYYNRVVGVTLPSITVLLNELRVDDQFTLKITRNWIMLVPFCLWPDDWEKILMWVFTQVAPWFIVIVVYEDVVFVHMTLTLKVLNSQRLLKWIISWRTYLICPHQKDPRNVWRSTNKSREKSLLKVRWLFDTGWWCLRVTSAGHPHAPKSF